jgi:RNA polymerase sigma factor (sigma-70 family)
MTPQTLAALTDLQLMEKAKTQDMTSYAVLFKRHADRIWRLAYMILHSWTAAEDVVQETFTRGLTHIASYRGEAEPRAWFSSIALNLCRHYLRDRNKEAEFVDSSKLERGGRIRRPRTRGALSSAVRRETNRLLAVALGFLTQAQREVFVLHYVDELPYEDVGQILDIRPGAARALAHRAKAALQKKLGPALEAILNPAKLDPAASVDFCGACHATFWDVKLANEQGIAALRSQPNRLQSSRCWGAGDARLTCVACHDPHVPLVREAASYDTRCLSCHVQAAASSTTPARTTPDHPGRACPVARESCVTCHMPKYDAPGMHHEFTDHWIRIVRAGG